MKKQVLEFPVGTYKGEVKNNLPHGKGIMNFKNGIHSQIISIYIPIFQIFRKQKANKKKIMLVKSELNTKT